MIEKRTTWDKIEILPNGIVQVRFVKQLVEDGVVLMSEYHRTSLEPGTDPDRQMEVVNAHLVSMNCAPVQDYEELKRHCSVAHTNEKVASFKDANR